ncbi:MAG: DNA repair protein RadA [Desulfomonilaceae bacterium]
MKTEVFFECQNCSKRLMKWMGKCPDCGAWNAIVEKSESVSRSKNRQPDEPTMGLKPLSEINFDQTPRIGTGIAEFDVALGGGIVRRSVVLIGGDPGIGKTTLLMQVLGLMSCSGNEVIYVSGEESQEQIKLRADRLGIKSPNFFLLVENNLENISEILRKSTASVVVLDSVQSIFSSSLDSHPGSVSQVRHTSSTIIDVIKQSVSACFLIGHVTKDGAIAGPKILEHMVDTVMYFEGERGHPYRILRAVKNRFGSSNEIGVFEMGDSGLQEVSNPSELFLSERAKESSGSVVTALVEGVRPILAEVQALVTGPTPGQGRRACIGADPQRLALIVAVIEKKLGLAFFDQDIFVNVVGGIRATEPSSDLAIACALISSFTDKVIGERTLVFGEIGLAGEIRRVSRPESRLSEAIRLGFDTIMGPQANLNSFRLTSDVKIFPLNGIRDLMSVLF